MVSCLSDLPKVLVFAGHDPTGGAGIQADIESITANGCRCVSVITSLTAQNTTEFNGLYPQKTSHFRTEARLLLSDVKIDACKIGLIGKAELVKEICHLFASLPPDLPVVIDPVLVSGTGTSVATKSLVIAMRKNLFAFTTVLTPNAAEARLLTGHKDIHRAAGKLLDWGCRSVLVTGADEKKPRVENILFSREFETEFYDWERLPGTYHGSGCTLSSSIAAHLARGFDIKTAVLRAQEFTWLSLKHGHRIGSKQIHPQRFFKHDYS